MENHCRFVEYYKDGTDAYKEDVCFARTPIHNLVALTYAVPAEGGLNRKEIEFWVRFVHAIFADDLAFSEEIHEEGGKLSIIWELEQFHPNRKHNLLYTTAFRYPDEFSMIVRLLYRAHEKSGEEPPDWSSLFSLFHQMHADMWTRSGTYGFLRYFNYIHNHALVGGDGSTVKPITLKRFQENLRREIDGVQLHFS